MCVTEGSLDRLNRDELQGVIAHEFSHIVNGDMRLSLRLIGVLAGITALFVIGRMLWYSGGGGSRDRDNRLPLWRWGWSFWRRAGSEFSSDGLSKQRSRVSGSTSPMRQRSNSPDKRKG